MKKIIVFSQPTESNIVTVLDELLPQAMRDKKFSYMPSNGISGSEEYIKQWEKITDDRNCEFSVIDNTSYSSKQYQALIDSNILLITGGNTFQLLDNLRKSRLDTAIKEFSSKPNYVLAGFSAGAIVLTPTIAICNLPNFDDNLIGIKDLNGLNIVDFEIFPHYQKGMHEAILQEYRESAMYKVVPLSNEEYIVVNKTN